SRQYVSCGSLFHFVRQLVEFEIGKDFGDDKTMKNRLLIQKGILVFIFLLVCSKSNVRQFNSVFWADFHAQPTRVARIGVDE
ncbi:MAG: hypothetical protein L0287_28515, partial [Anaerolineae bacterium]|nr:hypothetical protein [Anaerolineae bacterium]